MAGTTYYIAVGACNAVITSPCGTAAIVSGKLPADPGVQAAPSGDGRVSLFWNFDPNLGQGGEARLEYKKTETTSWTGASHKSFIHTDFQDTVTGLEVGAAYDFRLRGTKDGLTGPWFRRLDHCRQAGHSPGNLDGNGLHDVAVAVGAFLEPLHLTPAAQTVDRLHGSTGGRTTLPPTGRRITDPPAHKHGARRYGHQTWSINCRATAWQPNTELQLPHLAPTNAGSPQLLDSPATAQVAAMTCKHRRERNGHQPVAPDRGRAGRRAADRRPRGHAVRTEPDAGALRPQSGPAQYVNLLRGTGEQHAGGAEAQLHRRHRQ